MGKELIYCGSDVIEADLLKKFDMYEYPDGEMIDSETCVRCSINCPKAKDYIPGVSSTDIGRYLNSWF